MGMSSFYDLYNGRVLFSDGQLVPPQADLDGIPERRGFLDFYQGFRYKTHIEQAEAKRALAAHLRNGTLVVYFQIAKLHIYYPL